MRAWTVCTDCGRHSPYGCRTCRPAVRYTLTRSPLWWRIAGGWTFAIGCCITSALTVAGAS